MSKAYKVDRPAGIIGSTQGHGDGLKECSVRNDRDVTLVELSEAAHKKVDELHSCLSMLQDQLAPLLRSCGPDKLVANSDIAEEGKSQLEASLIGLLRGLDQLTYRVTGLCERIPL